MIRKHALLSASGAKRWLACPPSARLEDTMEEQTSSYADEGGFAHRIAELLLRKELNFINPVKFANTLDTLTKDQYWSAELLEYMEGFAAAVMERVNEAYKRSKDAFVLLEQQLDFSEWVPEGFGTGDVVIISDGILEVIDLKYGKGVPVEAEGNPQLLLYGLGAYGLYSPLFDIKSVRVTIAQPRLDSLTSGEMLAEDLLEWGSNYVRPRAQLAIEGKGEYCIGDHCQFCRAKALCRARAAYNLELAQYDFQQPATLEDGEIGDILARADRLKDWVTDITEYAYQQAMSGKKYDGWKLVEGRSNRKYSDEGAVVEALKAAGYDEAILYERVLLGLTKMETLIGKKRLEEYAGSLIIKPPGKPALVPESDKRPELRTIDNAINDFKNEGE